MYDLQFPECLAGYELETEAKGYLVGVAIVLPDVSYDLTVYDVARLGQDASEAVDSDGSFVISNLLVVPRVTRADIASAVDRISQNNFEELAPRGGA